MSRPFPLQISPVGRQSCKIDVTNSTSIQDILVQLHDHNLQLWHQCEEIVDSNEKPLTEFPITINSPFYFIPQITDYTIPPSIKHLTFYNGSQQKEVTQSGRVIQACLTSFFKGPWRLTHNGHLISLKDLPPTGDIYVEQKTEGYVDVEIYGPNLIGTIIFEMPKTSSISDIYKMFQIKYGITDKYLFRDGITVDGPIINHLDDRGFLILQLMTYCGIGVNHRGHGLCRYGFFYRDSTILDLKKLIRSHKKIPVPLQELYFNGQYCDNHSCVFDIVQSSTDILEFRISRAESFLLNLNNETHEVQWDYTINDLKAILNIPLCKDYRVFLGVYPYDSSITVGAAFFTPNQIIPAWTQSSFHINVYDTFTHQKLNLNVEPGESLWSLRVRVSCELQINLDSFKMIFMGTTLDDKQTFAGFRIGQDSTISIIRNV